MAYLAGFNYIHEVIASPLFAQYIIDMMHLEVKPLLPQIPGVDIDDYINTLITRFSNPTLKDEVSRICLGESGKLPQFIIPSIAEQIEARGPISRLTLCVAAWFRYLTGIDEEGSEFKIDDPMAKELMAKAREGGANPNTLLGVKNLFGDDLRYDGRFVREMTVAMRTLDRRGARKTLEKYVDRKEDFAPGELAQSSNGNGTRTRDSSRSSRASSEDRRAQEDEIRSLRRQISALTIENRRLEATLSEIWKLSATR